MVLIRLDLYSKDKACPEFFGVLVGGIFAVNIKNTRR